MSCALALLAAAAIAIASPLPAHAGEGTLPAAVAADSPGLTRTGTGEFRWFGLEIYTATLWTRGSAPHFSQPFALELRYARSLKGRDIASRSVEEIESLRFGTPEQRRAWSEAMTRLFPDVRRGSTLIGLNLPDQGARFYADGQPIGDIAGREFARAFFSIWLDPRTSAPELRAALLGGG